MAGLDHSVREITDKLDAVGNTTAAMGKGFAIGSAALTALALFVSYAEAVSLESIDILIPRVIVGLFLGGMLPFLFSAMTMESVSKAAYQMIEEVRRQFRTIPGIMEGTGKPDYKSCVAISTTAALKEMLVPGIMAVAAPLLIGILLGTKRPGRPAGRLPGDRRPAGGLHVPTPAARGTTQEIYRGGGSRRQGQRGSQGGCRRRHSGRPVQGYVRPVHQHLNQADDHRVPRIRSSVPLYWGNSVRTILRPFTVTWPSSGTTRHGRPSICRVSTRAAYSGFT